VSATSCLAVGRNNATGKGLVEVWNGTAWSLANGSVEGQLESVSCVSATWCMAAGENSAGAPRLYRLKLIEGNTWSAEAQTPATPAGGSALKLPDVSCNSESTCVAVGSYYDGAHRVTLAERWNGTAWSVQATENGNATTSIDVELTGVSCLSATSCVAIGRYGSGTFTEVWNGTAWSSPNMPDIIESAGSEERLQDVSCASTSLCIAVGWYKESATGFKKAFAERWNGSAWALSTTIPSPAEAVGNVSLQDVSCPAATACYAVGAFGSEKAAAAGEDAKQKNLVESWDGTAWSVQSSPNSGANNFRYLNGVSCASTSACTAVGGVGPTASWGSGTTPVAVRYG
jgi:hypothetical protein